MVAVLGQILTVEPEPPSRRRAGIDPALEDICLKAMARPLRDRYTSAAALATDLQAWLDGDGARAPTGGATAQAVVPPSGAAPGDLGTESAERDAMRRLIGTLPYRQRAVLVLRYYEDLPETAVAELLGCSVGTVRSRTHRAVTRLRALLPERTTLAIRVPEDTR